MSEQLLKTKLKNIAVAKAAQKALRRKQAIFVSHAFERKEVESVQVKRIIISVQYDVIDFELANKKGYTWLRVSLTEENWSITG